MNTAGRLLTIYDRLVARGRVDAPMVKVWADVLDLSAESPTLEDDIVTCLLAVRSEIELLRSKLASLGAPEDLMHPGIVRFRDVASSTYINSSWSGLAESTSKPENRLSFAWANWVLRNEDERDMPTEQLATLRAELSALESRLQEMDVTPFLRSFIQRQLDAIRTALKVYQIQGVKPIEEALHRVAGAFTLGKAQIDAEVRKSAPSVQDLMSQTCVFIKHTADLTDQLGSTDFGEKTAYSLSANIDQIVIEWKQK